MLQWFFFQLLGVFVFIYRGVFLSCEIFFGVFFTRFGLKIFGDLVDRVVVQFLWFVFGDFFQGVFNLGGFVSFRIYIFWQGVFCLCFLFSSYQIGVVVGCLNIKRVLIIQRGKRVVSQMGFSSWVEVGVVKERVERGEGSYILDV